MNGRTSRRVRQQSPRRAKNSVKPGPAADLPADGTAGGSRSRREFLKTLAGATLGSTVAASGLETGGFWAGTALAAEKGAETPPDVAFFLVSDTHFLANREAPSEMDAESVAVCGRLVETLNRLPGESIPGEAGGGIVARPAGVIHAGDIIDTGDKRGQLQEQMQATEWRGFESAFGLTGAEGRLRFPVYELAGNHDSPHGGGLAIDRIKARNKTRPGLTARSNNGVHYAWDWNGVHFVNLGLIVGNDAAVSRQRRYAALDSLEFLIADLRQAVGDSGRPVILTHHVDIARYTGQCDPQAPADSKEWDTCDVRAFYEAIKKYEVAGIFYGHTHGRAVLRWDGESTKTATGIPVFNSDNASHFHSDTQAFFYVEVRGGKLIVREYQTKDRWQTGFWTPLTWQT